MNLPFSLEGYCLLNRQGLFAHKLLQFTFNSTSKSSHFYVNTRREKAADHKKSAAFSLLTYGPIPYFTSSIK